MPVNFILAFAAFFGEEYGWRYYLQPLLQKRFGLRKGVLILGVVWGLWHLPCDFFYYVTPDKGLIMTAAQIITCVTLGIFFAWAYMKTGNIWVPVILHYMNNNLAPVIANTYSADIFQNQEITWGMLPFICPGVAELELNPRRPALPPRHPRLVGRGRGDHRRHPSPKGAGRPHRQGGDSLPPWPDKRGAGHHPGGVFDQLLQKVKYEP